MNLLRSKLAGKIGCLECSFEKTPEKITVVEYINGRRGSRVWYYNSLAELNKDWEDYREEPHIIDMGEEDCISSAKFGVELEEIERAKECGLYFETREEAEKTIEKLKAWKRLKDKGFRFTFWDIRSGSGKDGHCEGEFVMFSECPDDIEKADLDLLFGGEE